MIGSYVDSVLKSKSIQFSMVHKLIYDLILQFYGSRFLGWDSVIILGPSYRYVPSSDCELVMPSISFLIPPQLSHSRVDFPSQKSVAFKAIVLNHL